VADINDRLDRLSRREEFDRRAWEPPTRPAAEPAPGAAAGDGFAEVLDAVGRVVRRHPGLSVMVADGRPGHPVIRVAERAGSAETGLVAAGPVRPRWAPGAPQPALPAGHRRPAAALEPGAPAAERRAPRHGVRDDRAADPPDQERPSGSAGGTIALPADTSQVVSRLAQLLRDDPSLAAGWGREAT
jgi:hypothetical protein